MDHAEEPQTQATQPELKQLMNDIFGMSDDEDEEQEPVARQAPQPAARQSDDAQLFGDESDDEAAQPAGKKLSRFSKGKKDSQKPRAKATEPKKRKRAEKPKPERKRKEPATTAPAPSAAKEGRRGREDDEDSYASGSEVEANADDRAFIDEDDDHADLVKEYDEENPQNFDDERPSHRQKDEEDEVKELNVVDQALQSMKKKKQVELSRDDRRAKSEGIVDLMREAADADAASRQNLQPALEKLRLLPHVRQLVVNRQLQEDLLDSGLLTGFRAWLEPPAQNELPTLELRTAIYKMLYDLPVEASHLKNSQVGRLVMALYKHPKETVQNKKALESIIQKWSRLIFVSERHQEREVEQPVRRPTSEPQPSRARPSGRLGPMADRSAPVPQKETFGRVHVPISRGFNFKVQPESSDETRRAALVAAENKNAGGVKARLMKKSGSKGVDKNFRSERVSIEIETPSTQKRKKIISVSCNNVSIQRSLGLENKQGARWRVVCIRFNFMSATIRVLSSAAAKQAKQTLNDKGYVHLKQVLPPDLVHRLKSRFMPLFRGEFETGVYPDEWHWREGISRPEAAREICNAWKSDRTIASVILSRAIGEIVASITNWPMVRIGQDDVIWKPPHTGSVAYHRDSDYISTHFTHTNDNSVTVWMPLDDANEHNGTIEYAVGSQKWAVPSDRTFHSAGENYRESVIRAAKTMQEPPTIDFETVCASAGDIVIHHQHTWHGSGPNRSSDQHRRTLVGHYLRGDIEFRLPSPFAPRSSGERSAFYIYARYCRPDSSALEDHFFPVVFPNNARSSWIDPFTQAPSPST